MLPILSRLRRLLCNYSDQETRQMTDGPAEPVVRGSCRMSQRTYILENVGEGAAIEVMP